MSRWTLQQGIDLCRIVESVAPDFGCHVALTGGLLYKDGARKDCDLIFYRIRQVDEIDLDGLFARLLSLGLQPVGEVTTRFVIKATYQERRVDCLFPEVESGAYENVTPPGAAFAELFVDAKENADGDISF